MQFCGRFQSEILIAYSCSDETTHEVGSSFETFPVLALGTPSPRFSDSLSTDADPLHCLFFPMSRGGSPLPPPLDGPAVFLLFLFPYPTFQTALPPECLSTPVPQMCFSFFLTHFLPPSGNPQRLRLARILCSSSPFSFFSPRPVATRNRYFPISEVRSS